MYFVEKTKGINYFKQFDYLFFGSVLILSLVGMMVLSSAVKNEQNNSVLFTQGASIAIGIVLALLISVIDYKDFKTIGIVLYAVSLLLLVVVLFKGVGLEEWGAKSWLQIPIIKQTIQPSEIAKITFVVITAVFFERIKEKQSSFKDVIKLVIYAAVPIALILRQPDIGTSLVFMFMFAVMIFICGIPYRYIFITVGTFLASAPLLWFFVLAEYQKNRIRVFLNPESDPLNNGFQVIRAKLAIGSGQLFGKGLYQGIQTQSNGVPINDSDFIFTVIGEEFGFIGAIVVIVLILVILLRGLMIARISRDSYGSFLVVGLISMMGFHFIENIGMCIGVLPVTGIPLPFVSKGGSAMITNFIAVGIILSVSMRRKRAIFNSSQ